MITRVISIFLILLFSTSTGYAQYMADQDMQEILSSNKIVFQIFAQGCSGGNTTTITISKQGADRYTVSTGTFPEYVSTHAITLNKLQEFARLFVSEMKRKPACGCTTHHRFTLSAEKKEIHFGYNCCSEKDAPYISLPAVFGLSGIGI